jgi:hypothetical protein
MKMRLLTEKTIMELRSLLSQLLKDIRSTYKVDLRMSVESVMEKGKQARVFIEYIEAKMAGHGALALQKICDWADKNNIVLGLKASEDFGTAKEKLISIYKHFGFVPIIAEMERPIGSTPVTQECINKYGNELEEGFKMLTEKKKTPIMIQRLKNKKKFKGVSKEDIEKYATEEEKEMLEEKKVPPMIKRLQKKGKMKKVKEDLDDMEVEDNVEDAGEADEETTNDLIAELILNANDEALMALMALIQGELESRGLQADVTVVGGDEEPEEELPELEGAEDEEPEID